MATLARFTSIATSFLLLMLVSSMASAAAECSQPLGNDEDSQLEASVGVHGLSKAPEQCFWVILTPHLDRKAVKGVRIPENLKDAVAEMERMIPDDIKDHLVVTRKKSQLGNYYDYTCEIDSDEIGQSGRVAMISRWMSKYWALEDSSSPFSKWYLKNIADDVTPTYIAAQVMLFYCINRFD